ncbi:hypothetical protein [Pontibacter flavimaris]|uniref:hypothetical protein n=1 Tax=Pontibacter flavimaris TaxID=1797110 RepID=UPI001115158D|nr:hypothetical protein [Pontibacter flavimaris]
MNRTLFIVSLVLLIAFYILWGQLGNHFGGILVFVGMVALIYFRRRYLDMRPYWTGSLSDIPKYFKLP